MKVKTFIKSFFGFCLLFSSTQAVHAQDHHEFHGDEAYYGDCAPCKASCFDDFQFKASLLYLKPSVEQSAYVISSTNNRVGDEVYPNGKRHLISTDYKPGFRVEVLHAFNERRNLLDLRFTYFKSNHSDSTSGDFLFDAIGYPGDGAQSPEDTTYAGRARLRQNFQFYSGDATISRMAFDFCPDNVSFLFGLHYAYVGFKQNFTSEGSYSDEGATLAVDNHFRQKSSFWGIGPQIGIDYNYLLNFDSCPGQLALNASARGMLLCSNTHANLHYTTQRTGSAVGVNLKNDKQWKVNPAAEAQLGLSYLLPICGIEAIFEIGYEFMWYSNCVDKITSYDVAFAGDTLDVFDNLSLHGPFASVNVAF
jgi:hypothetical protein